MNSNFEFMDILNCDECELMYPVYIVHRLRSLKKGKSKINKCSVCRRRVEDYFVI